MFGCVAKFFEWKPSEKKLNENILRDKNAKLLVDNGDIVECGESGVR